MIVVGGAAKSQDTALPQRKVLPILQIVFPKPEPFDFKKLFISCFSYKPFLPVDFYSKKLSFFCKQEIKMDKIIKVPFRFRLGSVEQCDWLEGKRKR